MFGVYIFHVGMTPERLLSTRCGGGYLFLKERAPCSTQRALSSLLFNYRDRLGTLWAFFGIKADSVTLGKGFESRALDGRVVYKDILTVFACYKAEAF